MGSLPGVDAQAMAELEALTGSAAVVVATRDDELRTHIARAWGPRLFADEGRLELAIPGSDSPSVVEDLKANGAIAVTFALPTTYKAMQAKGIVEWMGELGAEDHERVQAHLDGFLEQVMAVGMTRYAVCFFGTGLVGVRIRVDEVFEQTPGEGAGRAR